MAYRFVSHMTEIVAKNQLKMELAIRLALEDIRRTAEPNTPKDTGMMRSSAIVMANEGVVNWQSDYAVYQENKQYSNYTTPGTGPHFARNAVDEVSKRFAVHLKAAGVI